MAEQLEKWGPKTKKKFEGIPEKNLSEMIFFRDPLRPHIFDHNSFFSPADGIILYQKIIKPNEEIEIKGRHFSLNILFEDDDPPKVPCLCIGIFMTYLDVHVNRMPTSGILNFKLLPPLTTYNYPMLFTEKQLLAKNFIRSFNDMKYENYNARMLNKIYNPLIDYSYWLIQIADDEVNTITHFTVKQNQFFHQNSRFSFVRWGSQVDLILPLDNRYNFVPILPDEFHVEGCVDKIIKIFHR
jgi:phosphatidylserine decarboxylase